MTQLACSGCGRADVGDGLFCRWCDQSLRDPSGSLKRATIGRRLSALFLDVALLFVLLITTLGIGYLIWWLIVLGRGQTPGKQIVGIRAMKTNGQASGWGTTFLREFVAKQVVFGILSLITAGIAVLLEYLWALWDRDFQTLHDKIFQTVVVRLPSASQPWEPKPAV